MEKRTVSKWFVIGCLNTFLLLLALTGVSANTNAVTEIYGLKLNWPTDSAWRVLPGLNDPNDSLAYAQLDFVGDALNPGAYYYNDGTYLYFRFRVHSTTPTFLDDLAVIIDNSLPDSGNNVPDYGIAWDSKSNDNSRHGLEMQIPGTLGTTWNGTRFTDIDGTAASKTCNASPPYACDIAAPNTQRNDTADGYIRIVDNVSTTNFGATSFVDLAVSWSYLTTNTTLAKDQLWRIGLASINGANDHNFLSYDIAGGAAPGDNIYGNGTIQNNVAPEAGNATHTGWSDSVNSSPTLAGLGTSNATISRNTVRLEWQTLTEMNALGFNVWRRESKKGLWEKINAAPIDAQHPGELVGAKYTFKDKHISTEHRYWYKIEMVTPTGQSEWSKAMRINVP